MIVHEGVGYGDSRLLLKQEIGAYVREHFPAHLNNSDRFFNLTYRIRKNTTIGRTEKFMIQIRVSFLDVPDSKYPALLLLAWLRRWKYWKAVKDNYLTWFDKIRLYGLLPPKEDYSVIRTEI